MTFHEAQGKTISNVVLALCERPTNCLQMKIASIFVSFSRVKFSKNIQLLLHSDRLSSVPSYKGLKYITKLSLPSSLAVFHDGFKNDNGLCQLDKALQVYFKKALSEWTSASNHFFSSIFLPFSFPSFLSPSQESNLPKIYNFSYILRECCPCRLTRDWNT